MGLAVKNNNPGNLRDVNTGTFRQFGTPQEGFAALMNDLQAKKTGTTTTGLGPDSTLVDFAATYAPKSDNNNPGQYAANLANKLGVRPDARLRDLDVPTWAGAVAQTEDTEGHFAGAQIVGGQNKSVGNYTKPPETQPYKDTENTEQANLNPSVEIGKGAVKGLVGGLVGMGRIGGAIQKGLSHGADALFGTKGFGMPQDSILQSDSEAGKKIDQTLASKNAYQTGGKVAEGVAEFLVPTTAVAKGISTAKRLANVTRDALEIVAPKLSKKNVAQGLSRGLGGRSGSEIVLNADKKTTEAAKAIEDLVRSGAIKVKDTVEKKANTVLDEIGNVAEDLRVRLRSMEVQPILSPEELGGLIQKTKAKFEESPLLVGDAGKSAERIFNKFVSLLPKGRDIIAEDILDARQALDAWMRSEGRGSAFDPRIENAISTGLREIRQGANKILTEKAPNVPVREMFQKQTSLYDALDNIIETGWKDVGTNALQRLSAKHPYISGAIGGSVGGLLPLGLGAYAYDKLKGN